ncbi:MAG TPA: ABC transporter ATP-binding protein [Vicinamibacterales bacterium]|jgi:ABC-2 type transport system ATP-binding protein|nr:ABC transporter ATP-binding protein [Vicinamibacterales bacterium]
MQARLEARELTKYYAAIPAIRDVSFTLEPGTILGLLGPNGSGKSTTVSLLTGLREPSAGQIWFDGRNITDRLVEYKARVGYVPEEAHLYTFLSAREHLELIGRLRRLPAHLLTHKISTLLDLFGLTSAADQPISGYSKGMKQKVLLIAALLHDPDLLILDEPESGLDLTAGLVLRHLIPILAARGKTILYSSHVLDHVERLCADVVVLHHGRIVAEGPVSQLRAMTQRNASLEDVIAQLVTTIDPARTAGDIADVSGLNA